MPKRDKNKQQPDIKDILYRKTISEFVTFVDTDDPRLTAVILSSNIGPILLVCVYRYGMVY